MVLIWKFGKFTLSFLMCQFKKKETSGQEFLNTDRHKRITGPFTHTMLWNECFRQDYIQPIKNGIEPKELFDFLDLASIF